MKTAKFMSMILSVVFVLGFNMTVLAQETKQEVKQDTKKEAEKAKISNISKEITGEVSAVNKNGIAIIYNRDLGKGSEDEIFVPLDNTVKLVHKQSIADINVGDVVSVLYEEVSENTKEGVVNKFAGKIVTFVKPAVKKPAPVEPPTVSDEENIPLTTTK